MLTTMKSASLLRMVVSWRCGPPLFELLKRVQPNSQNGEVYLTDIISTANQNGQKVTFQLADEAEISGVNDRADLAYVEAILQQRLRYAAMQQGVTLIAPDTVFLSADTILERDVIIEPHVVIGPKTKIGEGSIIKSFSHVEAQKLEHVM